MAVNPLKYSQSRERRDPEIRLTPLHPLASICVFQTGNRQDFSAAARQRIMEVVNTAHIRQRLTSRSEDSEDEGMSEGEDDTWVFPLVQMKPLGIQVDEQVTQVSRPELNM